MRILHTVSKRPRIVQYKTDDGLIITEGGECHRCDEWPTSTVRLAPPYLDDVQEVCLTCITALVREDYNAHAKEGL